MNDDDENDDCDALNHTSNNDEYSGRLMIYAVASSFVLFIIKTTEEHDYSRLELSPV